MELLALDTEFRSIAVVDFFESVIWTDRYAKAGDFEIYTPVNQEILQYLKQDYYLATADSEHMMIIESILISSDFEEGDHFTVTGRSLESLLDRRIVWNQTIISGNLQNGIKTLLNDAIINPSIAERKIENFIFEESDDPAITELTIDSAQYTGDSLYDVITKLCETYKIGFKITLNDEMQFVFKLYAGKDRSYNQTENPFVIFSPAFENIVNSSYLENKEGYKTVTLVAGEGEGAARKTTVVDNTNETGVFRRELYTDARDISSNVDGGEIPADQYYQLLQNRGKEKLEEAKISKVYDGQAETTQMFVYGKDFFIGDIVQLENEYEMQSRSRVVEMVMSLKDNGYDVYPTFEILEDDKTNEEGTN